MAADQKYIRTEYADGSVVLSNLRNKKGIPVFSLNDSYTATKVTTWYDGSAMDDSKADGKVYLKLKDTGEYFKVNLPKDKELFLEKDTMAQFRSLSSTELLLLKMEYYKGVRLNGYYTKGDTPAPIEYYISVTTDVDDGGSVIEVSDVKFKHSFFNVLNVRHFGAKCDNSTIDTIAWQNSINYCKNNSCKEVTFSGLTKIDETLYFDFAGITISGDSPETAVIRKIGNKPHVGFGQIGIVNYDIVDAVFMSVGYVGDFTFTKCKIESLDKSAFVLYLPLTYRFMLDDIYMLGGVQNLRCIQTYNVNIRKTRSRFADYGFVFEGNSTSNPQQHTSINFDNTYAEYCKVGYKLVNIAYFSGNSLSADHITECCYWFWYCTGAINGMGTEKSEGQLIRNWASNMVVNGHQVLEIRNYTGTPLEAKSKAKFEVWSGGRTNTGLLLNASVIRGYNAPYKVGDAEYFWSDVGTTTKFNNHNHLVIEVDNIAIMTIGGILERDNYDGYNRAQSSRAFQINSIAPLPYTYGYNQNRTITRLDEVVVINTSASNASMGAVTIQLSDILRVFPDFTSTDPYTRDFFSVKLKTNIFTSITPVSGNNAYPNNAIKIGDTSPFVTSINIDTVNGTVVVTFNTNVNRPILTISRLRNGFMSLATVNSTGAVKQSTASADSATAPSATYTQTEVQSILTELRDLKTKLRTAGILAP